MTLTFDLEHLQCIACVVMELCSKFERSRAIRGGVVAISIFDLMTLNIALHVALGYGIIFTKFDLRQLFHVECYRFYADMFCHAVTLSFEPLTLKVRGTSSVTMIKVCPKFEQNRAIQAELLIILRIFAHVMSRCDLDF